jgi:hypothetical protein
MGEGKSRKARALKDSMGNRRRKGNGQGRVGLRHRRRLQNRQEKKERGWEGLPRGKIDKARRGQDRNGPRTVRRV